MITRDFTKGEPAEDVSISSCFVYEKSHLIFMAGELDLEGVFAEQRLNKVRGQGQL